MGSNETGFKSKENELMVLPTILNLETHYNPLLSESNNSGDELNYDQIRRGDCVVS